MCVLLVSGWLASTTPASGASSDALVELQTGAARLEIPIQVPPGPGGLVPKLALRYSSRNGDGPFGVGWTLQLGQIECSARFGIPEHGYATCPRFELDGQLLTREGATHLYHPFVETFQRIEYRPTSQSWEVTSPDGTIFRYGVEEDARVRVGGDIARWHLSEIEDPFGNRIFMSYDDSTDLGTRYPVRITYGASATKAAGQRSIAMVYGELRPDPLHDFAGGVERTLSRRLTEIVVSSFGAPVRRYAFGYDLPGVDYTTGRSRLSWVRVFGDDCTGPIAQCTGLPRQEFEYTDPNDDGATARYAKFEKDPSYVVPFAGNWWVGATPVRIADVNGDGLPDLVKGGYAFGVGNNETRIEINTGSGFVEDPAWTAALLGLEVERPRADFQQIEPDYSSGGGGEVFRFGSVGIFEASFSSVRRAVGETPPAAMARPDARYSTGAYQSFASGLPQPGWIEGLGRLFLTDVDADGLADIVVSVRLSGVDEVLAPDGTPIPPAQVQREPGRVVQQVYRNAGDPAIGWIEDPQLAAGLPPFGVVQFESGYGAESRIPFGVSTGWDIVTNAAQLRTDPCSVRGLDGLWSGWNVPANLVPDVCMNYVNLDPRFLDLNGDGYLDLMVLEMDDPEALYQGFMDYARSDYDRGADAPPLPDNHAKSVAWIQVPDAAPGEARWVRSPAHDLPNVPFQLPAFGGHSNYSVSLPFAHSQPHLRAALAAPPNCPGPGDMPNWEFCAPLSHNTQLGIQFADLNRDGLADVIWSRYESAGGSAWPEFPLIAQGVFLNTGTGWCSSVPELVPWVESACADASIYLPPASSYPSLPAEPSGFAFHDYFYTGTATGHLADLNADGFLDYIQAHTDKSYPGNKAWLFDPAGANASPPRTWVRDPRYDLDIDYPMIFYEYADALGFSVLDINGDGAADVVGDDLRDASSVRHPQAFVSRSKHADLLRLARNGRGGQFSFSYESAIRQRDSSPQGLEAAAIVHAAAVGEALAVGTDPVHMRWSATPVVSALRIAAPNLAPDAASPGSAFAPPTTYRYAHPRYSLASRSGLGFRIAERTSPAGDVVTSRFYQAHGRARRTASVVVSEAGVDLRLYEEEWEIRPQIPASLPGSMDHPDVHVGRLARTRTMNRYVDGSTGAERIQTFEYDDAYGYDFVWRSVESRPTAWKVVVRTPESDPSRAIFGLIAEEKVFDRPGAGMTDLDFLAHRVQSHQLGRPTSIAVAVKDRDETGAGTLQTQTLDYDAFGNLTKRTLHAPSGDRVTDYCYDGDQLGGEDVDWCPDSGQDSHSVRVGSMDAIGGILTYLPDAGTGTIVELRSSYADEPARRVTLDAFGRPVEAFVFDGTSWLRTEKTLHDDVARPPVVERFVYPKQDASEAEAIWSATVGDGFGGGWKEVRETPSGSVATLTHRDSVARLVRRTLPVECADMLCSDSTGEFEPAALAARVDALGRPVREDHPHGFSIHAYSSTTRTTGPGPLGVPFDHVLEKNGKGDLVARAFDADRVVWIDECGDGVGAATVDLSAVTCSGAALTRTHYTYEATGGIESIHDARAVAPFDDPTHRLRMRRDTLGRIVRVDDPALGGAGHTRTTYDAFGNLASFTNARGQQRTHTYDRLNRLTGILTPSDETDFTLTYQVGLRKRRGESSDDYQRSIEYDAFGRLAREHLAIRDAYGSMQSFHTDYTYDLIGRVEEVTHPARHYAVFGSEDTVVRTEYDGGYLEQVCELGGADDCDAAAVRFASDMVYDGLGRLESFAMASGIRSFDYDPDTQRLERDRFVSPDYDYTRSYTRYDGIGNVLAISGSESALPALDMDETYAYDERNRIRQWEKQGVVHDYAYDDLGNLTLRAGTTQVFDDADRPYAIRRQETSGSTTRFYAHDADGNVESVLGEAPRFFEFDSANRLVCISESSSSCDTRVAYDVDGRRIADYPSGGRAFNAYVGDAFVYSHAQVVTRASLEIRLGGRRIALKRFDPELRGAAAGLFALPISPAWLAGGVGGAGLLLVCLVVRNGRPAIAEVRLLRATIATGLAASLIAPPTAMGALPGPNAGPLYGWEISDPLGTGLVLLDADGRRLRHQTFTPFGRVHDEVGERLRTYFADHRRHDDSGLFYMQARWYDPESGGFLSVDPLIRSLQIPKSANPYSYTENNPVNRTDPTGTESVPVMASPGSKVQVGTIEINGFQGGEVVASMGEEAGGGSVSLGGGLFGSGLSAGFSVPGLGAVAPGPGYVPGAGAPPPPAPGGGIDGFFTEERVRQLHALATTSNATASFVIGGGSTLAGFGALTVDAEGNVSFDFGIGVGAGEMSVLSIAGQAELRGGEMGPIRLEFMAGGAVGGGALQRSSVALTGGGAATGGGFLVGQGGFVFAGPTFSIPLGNVSGMSSTQEAQ